MRKGEKMSKKQKELISAANKATHAQKRVGLRVARLLPNLVEKLARLEKELGPEGLELACRHIDGPELIKAVNAGAEEYRALKSL